MQQAASARGPRLYARTESLTKTPARQWLKTGILLLMLFALGGCGVRMLYSRIPFLVGWELDSALDLNATQEDWLEQRLHAALRWHQQEQLPQIAVLLKQLEDDLRQERLDAERIVAVRAHAKSFGREVFAALKPDAVQLLSELNDAQAAHLLERSAEELAENLEEIEDTDADERREQRYEVWLDKVEDFTGKLDKTQRALVRQHSDGIRDFHVEDAAAAVAGQQRLVRMLEQRQDRGALSLLLDQLTVDAELQRGADYVAAIEHERARSTAFYLQLWPQLTAKQKRHVFEKIQDWREDVEALRGKKL